MWKGPTLNMDVLYPFAALDSNQPKHLVRKKIPKQDRHLQKARLIATLKHDCLIKLESASEEKGEYYLLFEYVPMSLQKWYPTVTREFIQNYEQRLILFSRYIADKGILTSFRRQNMGVSEGGDAKYFLQVGFQQDPAVDKLNLKKKYKQQIKELMQYYIDKKNAMKVQNQSKPVIPQKKQNTKILKILQAIEKGKANLCSDASKQQSQAVAVQQNAIADSKTTLKPMKNMQNVFIQKEISKVNKIQVMVNNKPVEVLQHEFKREYASSSFYINGMPAVVLEREGQARRLLSPNDKLSRFQQVKYKQYKSMKTSGEIYVQDFINVLENGDAQKLTLPGSPRGTIMSPPKISIQNSPRSTLLSPTSKPLAILPEERREPKKNEVKHKESLEEQFKRMTSPKTGTGSIDKKFVSEKDVRMPTEGSMNAIKYPCQTRLQPGLGSKTNDLQKKVSEAIANSLSAINKFKNAKNTNNP